MTAATFTDTGAPPSPNLNMVAFAPGVAQVACELRPIRRIRLTLTAVRVAVLEANDYGSAELCTLPDKNLIIIGCEADLSLLKAGTTNGLVTNTDMNVAIGSAAASNATLTSTMINVLPVNALTANENPAILQNHSQAATSIMTGIADGATNKLYLNVAATITADDSLLATGTVDIFIIDVGNVTS